MGCKDVELVLETTVQIDKTAHFTAAGGSVLMMTPPIDEDYWVFRVRLSSNQAIVGFPKFSTIGIGFAHEDDWNTNLPCTVDPGRIWEHIKHNKSDDKIKDTDCIRAIEMVAEAGRVFLRARGQVVRS